MEITLLVGENESYKSLQVGLVNKFMMWEYKYHIILAEAYNIMLHWNSTYRVAGLSLAFNPDSHMSFLLHEDDE